MKRDEPHLYKCQSKPACGVFLHALSFVVHNHQTLCDWHRIKVCRGIPPDAAIKRGKIIYFIRQFLSGSTMSDVFWFIWGELCLYNTPLSLSQWIIHVSHYLNKPHKFFVFYLHFFITWIAPNLGTFETAASLFQRNNEPSPTKTWVCSQKGWTSQSAPDFFFLNHPGICYFKPAPFR